MADFQFRQGLARVSHQHKPSAGNDSHFNKGGGLCSSDTMAVATTVSSQASGNSNGNCVGAGIKSAAIEINAKSIYQEKPPLPKLQ